MPPLRFPEFTDEWTKSTIGDCFELYSGNTPSRLDKKNFSGEINWITSGELKEHYIGETKEHISEEVVKENNLKLIPVGTFVIAIYGLEAEGVRGTGSITMQKSTISQACMAFTPTSMITNEFLYSWYKKHGNAIGIKYAQGTKQQNLCYEIIEKFKIQYPSLKEQEKLNHFISLLDERIATQSRIIDKLQSLIKGIIQRLVHDGLEKETWHKVMLSEILSERNELNIEYYPVHSVSVSVGIVNQVEYLGRSFAAKDTAHYNVVKYGDIVYTKSPTGNQPFGIIRQSQCQNSVAVSPLYGVYKPDSFEIGNILHYYFLNPLNTNNYLFPLIQKGAKNTINITNRRFLENSIPLPISNDEILSVSKALSSLNTKIVLENNTLYTLLKQKRYLLNMLFI